MEQEVGAGLGVLAALIIWLGIGGVAGWLATQIVGGGLLVAIIVAATGAIFVLLVIRALNVCDPQVLLCCVRRLMSRKLMFLAVLPIFAFSPPLFAEPDF